MWFAKLMIILFSFTSLQAFERYELEARKEIVLKSLEIAIQQVGIKEQGNNRGEVEKYWRLFTNYPIPYCAAAQYWTYFEASKLLNIKVPFGKTALALNYFNYGKKFGTKTEYKAEIHDFIIWRNGNTPQGHIERVIEVNGNNIKTIGFNTGSGDAREGDGVYYRNRNIKHIIGRLRVKGLIGFKLV